MENHVDDVMVKKSNFKIVTNFWIVLANIYNFAEDTEPMKLTYII